MVKRDTPVKPDDLIPIKGYSVFYLPPRGKSEQLDGIYPFKAAVKTCLALLGNPLRHYIIPIYDWQKLGEKK